MGYRSKKPGKEAPPTSDPTPHGGSRLRSLAGGIGGSISGGQYDPGGQQQFDPETGDPSGVSYPSISPYSVNHPWMDTIFNGGKGSALAAQLNNSVALQQLMGQQNLAGISATGANQLANTGLENSGRMDVERQVGQNAIAQAKEAAAQGRMTAEHKATLDILSQNGITPQGKDEYEGLVQPKNLSSLSQGAANKLQQAQMMGQVLQQPATLDSMGAGYNAQLREPQAKNMSMGVSIHPGDMYAGIGSEPIFGRGNTQGGTITTQKKTFTPQGIPSGSIDESRTIPGTLGQYPSPALQEPKGGYDAWKAQQAPTLSPTGTPMGQVGSFGELPPTTGTITPKPLTTINMSGIAPDLSNPANSPLNPANAYQPQQQGQQPDPSMIPDWLKNFFQNLNPVD